MRRGIVAFLVLLSFVPTAFHALGLYQREAAGIRQTKQFFLEQQAITVKEQDFEESFWRTVEYSAPRGEKAVGKALGEWASEMRAIGAEPWYGHTHGPEYQKLLGEPPQGFEPDIKVLPNKIVVVHGDEHEAIGATITVGSSKGIYLIPRGCSHEYA
ncbi:MAG: hypothetical protein KAW41_06630 [Candidatus Diapherotrites archaeon]|nr:hypothetical protein [Candidatus Diapherotrites archaeon]